MNIYFMFDNHLFSRVGDHMTPRDQLMSKAKELFSRDGSGSVFARDKHSVIVAHLLGHRQSDGHYGVSDQELNQFFDKIDEHINWEARG